MKKHILIVEDNEDNSLLTEKILKHHGFMTTVVSHGKGAINYCSTSHTDLILMDLSLPDIDGMEVTRLLRKTSKHKQTPIIALTAHVLYGIEETTQEAGLNDFLAKPFFPNDLIRLIEKYLSNSE